ncbi:MAG: RNA polymerase sigma factor [Lachnospiraceae bacterium]|jgi:RNA polymerase sigma factor (sigma-70 family)
MKKHTKENHFKEVYEKYCNLVMKIANSIIHDYVLAQDICQDVFVRYCEKGMGVGDDFLRAWFTVNTKRKAIDYLRKSYQKHEMVDMFDADKADKVEPSEADEMIDNIILKDMTCRFLYDLEKHNENWYKIIVGVIIENKSEKEVARELHMSPGSLRAKLHRAKNWIRENYKDEYEDL